MTGRFQRVRRSPIHEACVQGDVAEVKRLLDAGEYVNQITDAEQTLLHVAAEWGNTEVCEVLVNAGADLEAQDDWGDTPLYRACLTGACNKDMDAAVFLVSQGASLTHENSRHITPLGVARMEGDKKDVQVLQEARQAYEAEQSKKHLLESLDKPFVPTLCQHGPRAQRRM